MKENTFYYRLINLAKQSNKSINQIERDLGYPRNTLHNYRNSKRIPSGQRLLEISHYFGVAPEYLIGEMDSKNSNIEPTEKFFRQFNNYQKLELAKLCQKWLFDDIDKRGK